MKYIFSVGFYEAHESVPVNWLPSQDLYQLLKNIEKEIAKFQVRFCETAEINVIDL